MSLLWVTQLLLGERNLSVHYRVFGRHLSLCWQNHFCLLQLYTCNWRSFEFWGSDQGWWNCELSYLCGTSISFLVEQGLPGGVVVYENDFVAQGEEMLLDLNVGFGVSSSCWFSHINPFMAWGKDSWKITSLSWSLSIFLGLAGGPCFWSCCLKNVILLDSGTVPFLLWCWHLQLKISMTMTLLAFGKGLRFRCSLRHWPWVVIKSLWLIILEPFTPWYCLLLLLLFFLNLKTLLPRIALVRWATHK